MDFGLYVIAQHNVIHSLDSSVLSKISVLGPAPIFVEADIANTYMVYSSRPVIRIFRVSAARVMD